ncbi:hypothetical protein M1D72_12705 [Vibrio sp. AK197]|uniref:YnhF family membrane protein n=1 Tax=Vibrio olivae TaxID=1243002 RepID=A0ABV5HK32_9VIBR
MSSQLAASISVPASRNEGKSKFATVARELAMVVTFWAVAATFTAVMAFTWVN